MLVDSMTPEEVTKEILYDYILFTTKSQTLIRLAKEYNQERIRKKIDKTEKYLRFYDIKTKKKNTWLILVGKKDEVLKYQSNKHIDMSAYCYYYTKKGLRLFRPLWDDDGEKLLGIDVYNGHLFERYSERLNLGIVAPIDKIKQLFIDNPSSLMKVIKREGKVYTFTKIKNGLLLGNIQGHWIVNKTFVNTNRLFKDQLKEEEELIASFQEEIEDALKEDESTYRSKLAIMKGLFP